MPEYTVMAVAAAVVVVVLDVRWWHSGLFRRPEYWVTLGICLFFMLLVNGWLTKLSAPIVLYSDEDRTGWRFPLDIPVEDYLFGFTLVHLGLARWVLAGSRYAAGGSG